MDWRLWKKCMNNISCYTTVGYLRWKRVRASERGLPTDYL
jgi:hypothetical protein